MTHRRPPTAVTSPLPRGQGSGFTLIESPARRKGFTLIELLVVVTIIVVLLAMLTPALDQAIYQAELAKCMGNLKVIGTGAMVYAAGNRRHYPYRGLAENQG